MESSRNNSRRVNTIERPISTVTSSRRAARTPLKTGSAAMPESKPKLTLEQQLCAIERIERRDFIRGVGIEQFYSEPGSADIQPSINKNLLNEFERNTGVPTSVAAATNCSAGNPLLSSTGVSPPSDSLSEEQGSDHMQKYMLESVEDYASFPQYIKDMDKYIVLQDNFVKQLMRVADLRAEVKFQEKFPQKTMVTLLSKMDELTPIFNKFLKKPIFEQMQMFQAQEGVPKGDKKKANPAKIHCDVLSQQKFIESLHKINGVMELARTTIKKLNKEPHMTAKIENMMKQIESVQEGLENLTRLNTEHKDVVNKYDEMEVDNMSEGTSSTGSSPFTSPY